MVNPTPAMIIIHEPIILMWPVARRKKLIMTCRPMPTSMVTAIIRMRRPTMRPATPNPMAVVPRVLRKMTKGSTAAAVQSIEAAA